MIIRNLYLRPWRLSDAEFVLKLRNNPELRQYFRQERDLTLEEQKAFIRKAKTINYEAYILCDGLKRLGVFALHGSELCIAAPIDYHAAGLRILRAMSPNTMIFGDVFSYNPALKIYLNAGFEVYGVKEHYCKKDGHWVSAIKICAY